MGVMTCHQNVLLAFYKVLGKLARCTVSQGTLLFDTKFTPPCRMLAGPFGCGYVKQNKVNMFISWNI